MYYVLGQDSIKHCSLRCAVNLQVRELYIRSSKTSLESFSTLTPWILLQRDEFQGTLLPHEQA